MASYQYLDTTGVIVPDTADIKNDIQSSYQTAYGSDIDLNDETPQGLQIDIETAAREEVVNNNAALANQINPNVAEGVFFDAIWALMGGERYSATKTTVPVILTGVAGAVISAGCRVSIGDGGYQFELTSDVTIPSSGSITTTVQCTEYGAIPCAIGEIDTIVAGYSAVGWETVTNAVAGTTGKAKQTIQNARLQRKKTLALQGSKTSLAIQSRLANVDGYKSHSFRENYTSSDATIDGISLVKNSVWVCVSGGSDSDVATALFNSKSGGCAWNGSQSVSVTDDNSGQVYDVLFDRPTEKVIMFRVTVKANSSLSDQAATVQNAIIAYAAGEIDGEGGFVVGQNVSPYEVAYAINSQAVGIYIKKIEIAEYSLTPTYTQDEIEIALNEIATTATNYIQVVIA